MAYRGDHPAPLLPPSIRDGLQGWLWKLLGLLLLTACAALSASLLTWSVADPSLSYATAGRARNLLGAPGAILSDLVMQMLGLAGVFALLPPLFWALQLLIAKQPPGLRGKLLLAPMAVLFLAGALSSLPAAAAWPLHHGYGGVLGDLGLGLLSSLLAHVNPDRSAAAAGLFYFAAGLMVLMSSLGLSRQDLRLICQTNAKPGFSGFKGMAGWWREIHDQVRPSRQSAEPAGPDPRLTREPPVFQVEQPPLLEEPWAEPSDYTVVHEAPEAPADSTTARMPDRIPDSGRGPAFDRFTDEESRKIAERFAPAAGEARTSKPERREPALPAARPAQSTEQRPASMSTTPRRRGAPCRRPPLSMLKRPAAGRNGPGSNEAELRGQARLLAGVLQDLGIRGGIEAIRAGPVITFFEFEAVRGAKPARVAALADEIARAMGAAYVRVSAIPGRSAIGIEVPNGRHETIALRVLIESTAFRDSDASLPLVLGKDAAGAPAFADLARMPHLLVAGTSAAGKSVGLNAMILSLIYRLSPDQCRFLLIDTKARELSAYDGIPHLVGPVVTEPGRAVAALDWLAGEMDERYRRMARLGVRNIDVFNNRVRHAHKRGEASPRASEPSLAPMPYLVVVVDDLADLMPASRDEIEMAVQRLAPTARAAGIHLIVATRRPAPDVLTPAIKAVFQSRVCYKVASKAESRTVLDEPGAEQLLGQGDMLFSSGAGRIVRAHGAFVSDQEVGNIAAFLRGEGDR